MIGFVGLSHLGIVSSIAAASKTKESVLAYDPDAALCQKLQEGELPIFEPGLAELLKTAKARIEFSSDLSRLAKCSLVYFSPDIPTDSENRADLSVLRRLFENAVGHIARDAITVILSQVPPGFTRALSGKLNLFYQVETLVLGDAVERALKPERFIIGCADPTKKLPAPYESFLNLFGCPIFKMKYESAEMAKISVNVCLAATVSAANVLAEICEKINADWREIEPVLRLDKRIGPHAYLAAGLGLAGGNIERDLAAVGKLAEEWGADGNVTEAFLANSRYRKNWTLRMVHEHAPATSGSKMTVALWGLAYKAGTQSMKNSAATALLRDLPQFSFKVYDPKAVLDKKEFPDAVQVASALDACRAASALLVMTAWKEFSSVPLTRVREELAGRVILDPFGVLDENQCALSGFKYLRLGSRNGEAVEVLS